MNFASQSGWLRLAALFFVLTMLPAQAPSPPRLYSYHKLPSDAAWIWNSVVVDPPLTLTRDASGQAHLGIALTAGYGITTAQGTISVEDAFVPHYLTGHGVPLSLSCVQGRDFYVELDSGTLYYCIRTGLFGWQAAAK